MNAMNNFSVTGYICKDADVKNFDKAAIARFGIIIKHSERRGNETVTVSSILSLETWVKKEDTATLELLKKGKEVTIEGFFKPESYTKDGKNVTVLKNVATKITPYVRDKKQDAPKEEKKKKKA
ncbi:single-stranded DNA-binding protein [Prevotella melaninogenica]|nr:single-stranded DNA-binding protein [Prevotella melaninogenica]